MLSSLQRSHLFSVSLSPSCLQTTTKICKLTFYFEKKFNYRRLQNSKEFSYVSFTIFPVIISCLTLLHLSKLVI